MRLGFIKDENGKLVRKWVREGEENNPEILFHVSALFGDYIWADEPFIEEAKAKMLDTICECIRELAKSDKFWIVKTADDWWNDFLESPQREMHKEMSREEWLGYQHQELKDGKLSIGVTIGFPQMEGYFTWAEAEQLQKEMDACFGTGKE